ncbi:MAG: DUF3373 domain-containing protein [Nitrospirae bacterium]|nr:DUF3373 domain-containing protein [Nitrospirota bacterium]
MKQKLLAVLLSLTFLLPLPAFAVDQGDLMQKIDQLSKELDRLKQQMTEMQSKETVKEERITTVEKKAEAASGPSWLEIGGDFRFRADSLRGSVPVHDLYSYSQGMGTNLDATSLVGMGLQYPALLGFLQNPGISVPSQYTATLNQMLGAYAAGQMTLAQIYSNLKASGLVIPTNFSVFGASQGASTPKNDTILLNRVGLNLRAKATEDITVKVRLEMYKVWGNDAADPNQYFADRFIVMDGNLGHIPTDNALRVDQAFATWSNIAGVPLWFSVGRRPSTGGVPTNIRQNTEKIGTSGVPGLLVDYAFDGLTLGYAPDIDALPGAYAKFCYGKGNDTGFRTNASAMKDTNFVGLNVVPYDTDALHVELQWQRGMDIFAFPGGESAQDPFGLGNKNTNVGDITWWGAVFMGRVDDLGPGNLNWFATGALSRTSPNGNTYNAPFIWNDSNRNGVYDSGESVLYSGQYGLLYNDTNFGGQQTGRTGSAIYLGARYDIKSSGTKIGAEFNHGSKYWMAFTPAADDLWTSKLAARGNVYELYLIQQLNKKPIAKRGDAFVRLGFQHYDYQYTGSGFWLGAPQKISDLTSGTAGLVNTQMFQPIKSANDIYFTFDVVF